MNSNLYSILEKNSNKNYDKNKISQYIIKLKFCNDESKKSDIKFLLFKSLSKLIIKAVNNFFCLVFFSTRLHCLEHFSRMVPVI